MYAKVHAGNAALCGGCAAGCYSRQLLLVDNLVYSNKDFRKAYIKDYPESGSDEYWKLVKKTGGPGKYQNEYVYLYNADDPQEVLRILLKKEFVIDSGEAIHGAKIYQWIKSPFDNFAKHTAVLAIIPDSSELVMSTSKRHLIGQVEARLGLRELASDHMDRWAEFEPLDDYIDLKSGWGLYIGQDMKQWEESALKRFNYSDAQMEKARELNRWRIPLGRLSVFGPKGKGYLERWVFIYNLNAQEIRQQADRLLKGKYRGMENWAKDPDALSGSVKISVDGNLIIRDTVFDSEYKAWAYASPGFEHLDEKYKTKLKNRR